MSNGPLDPDQLTFSWAGRHVSHLALPASGEDWQTLVATWPSSISLLLTGYAPRWLVWENVPGVLSSSGGRDFGAFLGALAELGYGFAYRVLDAQYFGVAQRRRRVFVVGHLGDWRRAAAVLLEQSCLSRHPAPSREAREAVAGTLGARTSSGGGFSTDFESAGGLQPVIGALCARDSKGVGSQYVSEGKCIPTMHETVGALCADTHPGAYSGQDAYTGRLVPAPVAIQGNLIGRDAGGPHGVGASDEGTMYTLTKADVHAVAFSSNMSVPDCQTNGTTPTLKCGGSDGGNPPAVAFTRCDNGRDASVQVTPTMRCGSNYSAHLAVAQAMAVRRLTPVECERLQGFPDGYTAIPWRGKPASECPDGPRYRALGNSMAVPCMRWIGQRIAQVDAIAV